jgi:deoxyribodipyrimidine photo-lyase
VSCVIYWFRSDLRLADNPAFSAACQEALERGMPLLPVFVWDPSQNSATRWVHQRMGAHRQAWLAGTLQALDAELQGLGSRLLVLQGEAAPTLIDLATKLAALAVHAEAIPAPEEAVQSQHVRQGLAGLGCALHLQWQASLLEPQALPFTVAELPDVFTAFRQKIESAGVTARAPLEAPTSLPPLPDLPDLSGAPSAWSDPFGAIFSGAPAGEDRSSFPFHQAAFGPGERSAQAHLAQYLARQLPHIYKATRNGLSGVDFSSKFSPWLATGALSAPQVMHALRAFEAEHGASDGSYWLWFELLWRDHFRLLHLKHGATLYRARGLSKLPTPSHDPAAFQGWCDGRTGEPLVDAGMRELAATGWLSNRMRQVVASYLVHDLACDWRAGAAWFEHSLIDFDVHSNQGNWGYVAGRGTDPRGGRRFNIEKQTRDHDADGHYRRLWGTASSSTS